MNILGRRPERIVAAIFSPGHYEGMIAIARVFRNPIRFYYNYVFLQGKFPSVYHVRTPIGDQRFALYHIEDLLTANEIFARLDYRCPRSVKTIVDLGSNIGLSALYFLTRSPGSFVYAFEPIPSNIERFQQNLTGFKGRYELAQVAVAVRSGTVDFGIEPTGRLGSLAADAREGSISGRDYQEFIKVSAVRIEDVLTEILDERGQIDLLKIDVEGTEAELLAAIPRSIRLRVNYMHLEWTFQVNPIADTHVFVQRGTVATFHRHGLAPA